MKKILYTTSIALIALSACNNKPKDAKAELAALKKQQADINSKIAALEQKPGVQDSSKVTDVNVVEVKSGSFTNYVQLQGSIYAQDNVTAYPQSPGTITGLYVKAGQHVSKGQLLAQLDDNVLRQNIAQTSAQVDLYRTIYQRQKNLWDQKIGTEIQFLQAKTNLESGQKQLAALRQQAAMYTIKSPISGTVDQMDLKLGQVAQPGQTGIVIVNADNLKVKANAPESYSGRINQGDNVVVVLPDAADSLNAKLTFVAKVIDPASRSFALEVKLPTRASLRPNMTAVIKIADYTNKNAMVIPYKAIQRSEQGDYVFVDNNGTATKKTVKIGRTYGGSAEIVSGVAAGDKVITDGATEIEDGDKVKASNGNN